MRRFALLIALSVVAWSPGTPVAGAAEPFFPIMAWNHVPNDPAQLKRMRECGLTVAGFAAPGQLDAVHAAGMKAIVSDARVGSYDWTKVDEKKARENVASLVKEVNDHPAVIGYYLRDEPPASMFGGLATVASAVRELAPGKWPYINLFPLAAEPWQLETKDYDEYVDKFIAACKPTTLSYDHYAIFDDGSLGPKYFRNLEVMRAAAIKHGLPFWNIVLANSHFRFRAPGAAEFHFHAYTTLAYGGRGLAYFTYFAPKVGNYRMAPVDQFDHETPTWGHMQTINLEIAKLAPTILKLRSDDVYHFGTLPEGTHAPTEKNLLTGIANDENQFMAADFTHEADGSRWAMIVNRDMKGSYVVWPKFRTPPKRVQKLSPYTGDLVAYDGEQVWLHPGGGVLLKLE
jgi:hypothetical protein